MTTIDPLLPICSQHGIFLRREALSHGVDDSALRRACRNGTLVRVRHGAYALRELWERSSPVDRHALLARAVMRTHEGRVALSHHSSVLLHGVDTWRVPTDRVHVTRLDGGAGRVTSDLTHHEGLALPEDLTGRDGMPMTCVERAVLESASLLDVERGLVLADSALRQGLCSADDLDRQMRLMDSWPESLKLQLVTRLADGRSGSVGESRSRHLFWRMGLPAPELQYEVHDEHGLAGVVDFAWPAHRLLVEFDGKVKYAALLRKGESPADAVFREKQREDRLRRATGWSVVRLTWAMLDQPLETALMLRRMMRRAA